MTTDQAALDAETARVDELLYGLRAAHHSGAKRWYGIRGGGTQKFYRCYYGIRGGGTQKFYRCYICDVMIDTWSAEYPVPRHAVLALHEHRIHECVVAGIATTLDPRCTGTPLVTP